MAAAGGLELLEPLEGDWSMVRHVTDITEITEITDISDISNLPKIHPLYDSGSGTHHLTP